MEGAGSLGQGVVGQGSIDDLETYTQLYAVANGTVCETSQIQFANKSKVSVILNVYKRVNGQMYLLSPSDLNLNSQDMAQEDSPITLNTNDALFAVCDTADAIDFIVNGYLTPIS